MTICQPHIPEIRIASGTKLSMSGTDIIHPHMNQSPSCLTLDVVDKMDVVMLLHRSLLVCFKDLVYSVERNIVPHHYCCYRS